MPSKGFLGHLAGLRGLAIIFVLLFHLNSQFWSQGYLGVDVFLVITGYLLLRARMAHPGRESWMDFLRFLSKRFCRIVPPMTIIILLSALVGAFFLWWSDEMDLCRAGSRACLGSVNVFFGKVLGDYFAAETEVMPLLHLWYLSVTLQVYLIYAVANQAFQRMPRRWVIILLLVVGAASLIVRYSYPIHEILSYMGLPVWLQTQDVSYYSLFPRLWEVLAGGLIVLLPSLERRRVISTALVVLSMVMLVVLALTPWMGGGYSTILVVIATMMLIRYAPESNWALLLDNRILRWLGSISFSLYLVHMPIIVFAHMWMCGQMSVESDVLILLACGLTGWGFWWCIEKRRVSLWLAFALWGVTFAACKIGSKSRLIQKYAPRIEEPVYKQWKICTDEKLLTPWSPHLNPSSSVWGLMNQPCDRGRLPLLLKLGDPLKAPSFVLLGDSHGAHFYAGVDQFCHRTGLSGVYLTSINYPYHNQTIYYTREYIYTPDKEKALFEWLAAHPELTHVLIAQRWGHRIVEMERDMREYLKNIKNMGKKAVLIGPEPEFRMKQLTAYYRVRQLRGYDPLACAPYCTLERLREMNAEVYPRLRQMEKEGLCTIVDPAEALKPGERFESLRGNVAQMKDDNHYLSSFSIWLMERVSPQLQRALQTR